MSIAGIVLMVVGVALVSNRLGASAVLRACGAATIVAGALWVVAGLLGPPVRMWLFAAGIVVETVGPWLLVLRRLRREPRLPD